jgi:cyclomaltodextrinase
MAPRRSAASLAAAALVASCAVGGCDAASGAATEDSGAGGAPDAAAGSDGAALDGSAAADGGTSTGGGPIELASATIYSVFPKIYSQSGNLAAVTADLTRIHDLGFNVIYLLPVTPPGQPTGGHPAFGSPYCVHDYFAINPAFGSEQDLVSLVRSAHALGMHVILDEVLNHTAWDNPLLTQHPEFYLHSDGNPQNVASIEQAFTYADVAQLDYKTPTNGLAQYMTDMLASLIRTYDVDGFRFDTADNPYGAGRMIPATFWQSLRQKLEAVKSGLLLLGEEENPELAQAPFQLDYGWHLQGLYGASGLQQVANGGNAVLLQQGWSHQKTGWPAGMMHMTLLQDWDLEEDLTLYGGVANTMAAAVFTFTIDGVPLLFNGEEVGNDKSGVNTQAVINWNSANAARLAPFYKSLLALRNDNPALQQGSVGWVANSAAAKVVSYTRSSGGATFLVIINFSSATVSGTVAAPAASGWTDVSPVGAPGGNTHTAPPAFSLQAYDFAVFRAN